MSEKTCRGCVHPERKLVDRLLEQGFAPRTIVKRVGLVSRVQLTRHRDKCLKANQEKEEG